MKNYLRKKLHPISTAVGRLHKFFASQNSKEKYESMNILDFVKKIEKSIF
jgi:hypothetical protein